MVRILPLAAVHKKKDTLLGTFVLQMHYRLYIYMSTLLMEQVHKKNK